MKVYRNINRPIPLAGLEITDWFALALAMLVLFNLIPNRWLDVALLIAIYFFLRWSKKDKPAGYLIQLIRFVSQPPRRGVMLEPKTDKRGVL